uniref:Uncharacterized protein n=1 Tax=Anguilla anguilla TaxID=7936 RepID=A0A0E9TNY4_ANGAN
MKVLRGIARLTKDTEPRASRAKRRGGGQDVLKG